MNMKKIDLLNSRLEAFLNRNTPIEKRAFSGDTKPEHSIFFIIIFANLGVVVFLFVIYGLTFVDRNIALYQARISFASELGFIITSGAGLSIGGVLLSLYSALRSKRKNEVNLHD